MSQRYDTLVIGAGMSGLAAGIRLAHFGRKVALLERHYLWGGLNSFFKRDGRRFDTGLHALTNYAPKGLASAPLNKVLRQLRLKHEQLELAPQGESAVAFGDDRLRFSNDLGLLESEIATHFPGEVERFRALVEAVRAERALEEERPFQSARARLEGHFRERRLAHMLLLPALYYGSPQANDMDWGDFCVVFSAVFLEGLSRPERGIKPLLDLLRTRYLELGGELRLRSGVRAVRTEQDRVCGVELDDGSALECEQLLSSAGWVESMRLCGPRFAALAPAERDGGRLSFLESISVLDRPSRALGLGVTTLFYNTRENLCYEPPPAGALTLPECGVVSVPDNYQSREPLEGLARLTVTADHAGWCALEEHDYQQRKQQLAREAIAVASRYVPSWEAATVYRDIFTPRTIEKYTGHVNGAVYGSPRKSRTGQTPLVNLFLIGTDQGYLGVVGALMSGIAMANRYGLATLRG